MEGSQFKSLFWNLLMIIRTHFQEAQVVFIDGLDVLQFCLDQNRRLSAQLRHCFLLLDISGCREYPLVEFGINMFPGGSNLIKFYTFLRRGEAAQVKKIKSTN
jgi:hypothetical protein